MPNTTTPSPSTPTKAEQYVAAFEERVAKGTGRSDAIKAVAEQFGVATGTVRGSIYKLCGGSSTKAAPAPTDPIEAALALFQTAIDNIDSDIAALKEAADKAVALHAEAVKSADARRKVYEAKIVALGTDDNGADKK